MPTGQHKLRSQFERLASKYGKSFYDPDTGRMSSQAQVLSDYLSGVPVERGGGLGAFSPESGTAGAGIDINDPGESYRRGLLNQISSGRYGFDDLDLDTDLMRGRGIKGARELTPDEYFKFRQQLMASDPSVGNVAYKKAFPFASGDLLGGVASLMPGIGPLKAIAKGAAGAMGNLIPPEVKTLGRDLRTAVGGPFQGISDWFKFNPPSEAYAHYGTPFAAAPSVRPDIDRGGVIDAAQSVVDQQHPWGAWIGMDPNQPRTADFIDSDGDGVDDRMQTGPGTPGQGVPGGDLKMPGFEIGPIEALPMPGGPGFPHPITLPSVYPKTDIAASQAAGYDIPIGGGQNPNFQDWYKNLGIMQNVYS